MKLKLYMLLCMTILLIVGLAAQRATAQAPDYGYKHRCICLWCWFMTGDLNDESTWTWHLAWWGQVVSNLEATAFYNPTGQVCWQPLY